MGLGFGLLSAQARPGETDWTRAYDDTLRWTSRVINADDREVRVSFTWPCAEDQFGRDELYARTRVDLESRPFPLSEEWVTSPSVHGHCRKVAQKGDS